MINVTTQVPRREVMTGAFVGDVFDEEQDEDIVLVL